MEEFDNGLDKKFKFDFSSPEEFSVDLKKLKKFLSKDKNSVLIFYGGEPLMEIDKIKRIIDYMADIKIEYRMQTNGKLLNKIPTKYLNKITRLLVSIDGDKKRTDFNKGEGTYDKIIENLNLIRENGYKGEIVARMTIAQEFPDVYEQVTYLIENGFNSIHWQLDAGFFKFDFNEEKFKKFVGEYNKSITKLIKYWIDEMQSGTVIKIYPFLGIIESMLKNETTRLRCGAGYEGYAITTDGKVVACPIMNCIEDFKAGTLDSDPDELKKFSVGGRCNDCNYKDLSGGRCLYWNKAQLWPEQGDDLICNTIKHLIDELKKQMPKIKQLIDNRIIIAKQFNYEKYFGPEIIP